MDSHFLSSICRIGAPRVHGCTHSDSSVYMASTFGYLRITARLGCSSAWPCRKCAAELVSTRRIDRLGCCDNPLMMLGIFIVATDPDAASRRCTLPSLRAADTSCAGLLEESSLRCGMAMAIIQWIIAAANTELRRIDAMPWFWILDRTTSILMRQRVYRGLIH